MANGAYKVVSLIGSLRRDSFNRKLFMAARAVAPEGMELREAAIGDLPLFSQDLEADMPTPVGALHDAIRAADGLLFVTPEYNHGIPGVLKNAIDWASRPPRAAPIYGKPAGILGASPGMAGTIRAQMHLRQYLNYLNMPTVLQPEVLVARAHEKFDESGGLTDEAALKLIGQHLANLAELIRRYR